MRRKSRFFSNQLVTLGVLMCLLGVSLEVVVLAKQGPPPPPPVTAPCDSQCEWSDAFGYCGSLPLPACGLSKYCRGNPHAPTCSLCICVSPPGFPTQCDCWE